MVPRADDLRSALILSSAFAAAAAATVPLLLPALPAEARSLPLPLPVFCAVLAVQMVFVYGAIGFAVGLGCGAALVAAVAAIQRLLPGTLPETLHPPGLATALLASSAGSLGEEILFRLFALSCLLRLLPEGRLGRALAVGSSALAFGAAHAPAFAYLFGGWQEVPLVSWAWLLALNGLLGIAFGVVFLRSGIECAILAHFGTDAIWHVASQLLRA
jgi:hypothetical protein